MLILLLITGLSAVVEAHVPLALPGPAYTYTFDVPCDEPTAFCINGKPLRINERGLDTTAPDHALKTAQRVWDCSVFLAKLLERRLPPDRSLTVVELGAGVHGLPGMAAALLGHKSVLTDLPDAVPALQRNIAATAGATYNNCGVDVRAADETIASCGTKEEAAGPAHGIRAAAAPLDWTAPDLSVIRRALCEIEASGSNCEQTVVTVDLLLAADVVWLDELVPPLMATTAALLRELGVNAAPSPAVQRAERNDAGDGTPSSKQEREHLDSGARTDTDGEALLGEEELEEADTTDDPLAHVPECGETFLSGSGLEGTPPSSLLMVYQERSRRTSALLLASARRHGLSVCSLNAALIAHPETPPFPSMHVLWFSLSE